MQTAEGARTTLTETVDVPTRAGTYFLTRGDRRVGAVVVNPSPDESQLDRFTPAELRAQLGGNKTLVADSPGDWIAMAFRAAARRSLVQPALILALLMLILEAGAIGVRARRAA
jgi:hypothetical protein